MTNFSLISTAHAAGAGGSGMDFLSFLPLILVMGVMYVFFIRTQKKKDQQHRDLMASLKRGDRVLTQGGLIGVIAKVINDQEVLLEVDEGVRVRFARPLVVSILTKTPETPQKSKSEPASEETSSDTLSSDSSSPTLAESEPQRSSTTRKSLTTKGRSSGKKKSTP